jgi:hypothetical protein
LGLAADYIVGLTDGEGCFYVHARRTRSNSKKPRVDTHFYIKLHESDRDLLEKVKQALECGAVYRQTETRDNHSVCYRFEVNAQQDIHGKLIPFFQKHPLQSQKVRDFEIFREVAAMVRRKEHKTIEGFEKILTLKQQMNPKARRMREIRTSGGNST